MWREGFEKSGDGNLSWIDTSCMIAGNIGMVVIRDAGKMDMVVVGGDASEM